MFPANFDISVLRFMGAFRQAARRPRGWRILGTKAAVLLFLLNSLNAPAQVQSRIAQAIDSNCVLALKGTVSPLARPQFDIGAVSGDTKISGLSIVFKPSASQQAQINLLLQEQQTPGSPYYHQWLTPQQYASRFGMSAEDLSKVQTWLEDQGFSVDRIAPSQNRIFFSGTVAQINSAFQTEVHQYRIGQEIHIANATAISVPAAMAGVVAGLRNLSDFRPKPRHVIKASPQYTSSVSGDHFLSPADFATIYDVNPLYNSGYTGAGSTIVVVGQSEIKTSDVTNFRSNSGLSSNPPTLTLMPNTGAATFTDTSGDEDESDIDVEWSGAVAQKATINFVYVGNNQNYSVIDALQYAIEQNLAPIISISYGACEADFGESEILALQTSLDQANLQGQTVIAAAGDEGAADCDINPKNTGATVVNGDQATQGLAVDFPGSSPDVTSMGGTEFNGDVSSPDTYWNSSNSSSNASAKEYIPEEVWNDTSTSNGIEAGGGGKSVFFGKPSWQTGSGVPSDGARDVPDISLNASPNHDGYLYCASGNDTSSCSNGFRDQSSNLTVAGGTSFDAPTFAGVLTLINQQLGVKEQGNVNPLLYALVASNPDAFHDVTSGTNEVPCESGSTNCGSSGSFGYAAGAGYDLASGWGSIDASKLATAFAAKVSSAPSLIGTTTVLTTSTSSPTVNSSITFAADVSSDASVSASPTGTVQFALDGANVGSPVSLTSGSATYSKSFSSTGSHTLTATYSGDSLNSGSSASLNFTVNNASFALSATNVTVSAGSSGTSTVTVTPNGGFTGTVTLAASAPDTLTNSCYSVNNAPVTGTSKVTEALTIYTSESQCSSANTMPLTNAASRKKISTAGKPGLPMRLGGLGATLASVLLFGFKRPRKYVWARWMALALFAVLSLSIGCGVSGNGNSSTGNESGSTVAPAGNYTITVTGANGNLSQTANFTLTIQ